MVHELSWLLKQSLWKHGCDKNLKHSGYLCFKLVHEPFELFSMLHGMGFRVKSFVVHCMEKVQSWFHLVQQLAAQAAEDKTGAPERLVGMPSVDGYVTH